MSGFNTRLKNLISDNYGNANKFCISNNYDYSLIRSYIRGDSEPKISNCLSLAKVLNVSPSWLAYGEDVTNNKEVSIIDTINLIHIKIEEWLNKSDKEMDSNKKAELAKLIYQKLQADGAISESKIETIISILSAA